MDKTIPDNIFSTITKALSYAWREDVVKDKEFNETVDWLIEIQAEDYRKELQ